MKRTIYLLITLLLFYNLHSQELLWQHKIHLDWSTDCRYFKASGDGLTENLSSVSDQFRSLPVFNDRIALFDEAIRVSCQLIVEKTVFIEKKAAQIDESAILTTEFPLSIRQMTGKGQSFAFLELLPLRKNSENGLIEQLVDFELVYSYEPGLVEVKNVQSTASRSVLADGDWYKIRISESGIYKISYSDLQAIGIQPAGIDPRKLRLFGNGGGTLPENNAMPRYDDLVENHIVVVGEADGVMDPGDYILFYGQGPLVWDYNPSIGFFEHRPNYYDDYAYYYIIIGPENGKRLQTTHTEGVVSLEVNRFLDYQKVEQDLYNLTNTGRTWYGDLFDVTLTRNYPFIFPGLLTEYDARIDVQLAARAFAPSSFQIVVDNQINQTVPMESTTATSYDWATANGLTRTFKPRGDQVNVALTFNRSISSARGWLDYISVNAWRSLVFRGPQMHFNNTLLAGNTVVEMQLAQASGVEVWDITEAVNPQKMSLQFSGNTAKFKADATIVRRFIAFDHQSYLSVEKVEKVANQNLHGIRDIDYLIVTHPDFIDQAQRLANIHRDQSGLSVFVTTPSLIYNEFSSGAQDISAIRDFARMLYTRSTPGKELKYLLLFGDASFDFKDRITDNTNFVPTFQSVNSVSMLYSIATDDFFGYLDTNEGTGNNNLLDIGIGRFPVATATEAQQVVDKIVRYLSSDDEVRSPWRNEITLVSDDGDSNTHLNDSENVASLLRTEYPDFNLDKIHLDAYRQVATPGGQKAPDVNEAINRKMERGTLVMNYSGHGGEVGWAEERILEIADIRGWRNRNKLPIFITATCEFSRYDDAQRQSAGEMVFLNPYGGAIAMFTTARATYSISNLRLNRAIFQDNIFKRENGEYARFGDVVRKSKLAGDANDRKFVLLGDPALQLSFPHEKVMTTHINGRPAEALSDTLKALDRVTVKGVITNREGQLLSTFNGKLYATVFDKENIVQTYGDQGPKASFPLRSSVLNKSTVEVRNGHFEFSFIIPKDIAYKYGSGRISYYATDGQTDAQGYFEDFIVGGYSNNSVEDHDGPRIKLFIGDTTFVSGGFTDENPRLLALLSDENGINTTGSGIGHDLVANLSGPSEVQAILNEFFVGKLNSSTEGTVLYPFANLKAGKYTLTLKAWDVFNNSSSQSIHFEVVPSGSLRVENARNYPNPFAETTSFVVNHNQSAEPLDVEVQIFSTTGQHIRTLRSENQFNSGYMTQPILWDGKAGNGNQIAKGLYLYRVIVGNNKGQKAQSMSKLFYY